MSRQGETREPTTQNINEFWEAESSEWGDSPQVTIRDIFFRNHELRYLLSLIPTTQRMLDIGCGTGFGTLALAKLADYTLGLDYARNMIHWARVARDDAVYRNKQAFKFKMIEDMDPREGKTVDFQVGDLLDLSLNEGDFNIITGQRILINLPTHELQMTALDNLKKYSNGNSLLILVEATRQGHEKTDRYRKSFGIPILEKYWHNNYVDASRYNDWEDHGWKVIRTLGFDTYALLSKVIYPAAVGPENCEFLSGANQAACEISNIFRTKEAAIEIGINNMLQMYFERVKMYDSQEGEVINKWLQEHSGNLPDWKGLGHQQTIICRRIQADDLQLQSQPDPVS